MEPLYRPQASDSPTFRFLEIVNDLYELELETYEDLLVWSTSNIPRFWSLVWDETGVIGHKGNHVLDPGVKPSDNANWFCDARVNWAENMLRNRSSKVAVIQATEPSTVYPEPLPRQISYHELYILVSKLVSGLLKHGVKPGDRVASYSSNCIETLGVCLATAAVGGIWVSAAADFGPAGVLERFEQVQPAFIFAVDVVVYNNKIHDHLEKVATLLSGLSNVCKPKVIIIHPVPHIPEDRLKWPTDYLDFETFLTQGSGMGIDSHGEIEWRRGSFNDPLWILFSSGTTGRPKAIVHRVGGMLLQSRKELAICAGLRPDDVFFYYTTTGWMMYQFLVSGLASQCTLVLYDGSPLREPAFLWQLVDQLGISIFGTSAKYIDQLAKTYKPCEMHSLKTLRHIYSTGSPLAPVLFDWVYEHISSQVLLASITGGTDICSLFAGMCSALPVYRGELQCRMLGMAIESFSSDGKLNPPGEPGELVCTQPFPVSPLGFWPLPGYGTDQAVKAAQTRFHDAYFSEFEGVWYHGDHVLITRSRSGNGGGLIMLGRSDGVLNPGGIRFGSSEIYDVIDSLPGIVDSVACGQSINHGTDERVILMVKLSESEKLSDELKQKINTAIRNKLSPRHVPAKVLQVQQVPYTYTGKRVEVLVKKIINGTSSAGNTTVLVNPESLFEYHAIGESLRGDDM
ncbi:acetoacetyl-CoA synthetase [Mycena floridula]|nr:acetoacetyl-CoA synthetase [Mycena floridula]